VSIATTVILIALPALALWIPTIILGVREARRKNRSAHWMWLGINPMAAWVAFVVMTTLPPLKECCQCGEKVKAHAKICPYCMTPLSSTRG